MLSMMKKKSRVLVLDDDVAMQKLVAALLKREGHRVDVVGSGSQAIKALEKDTYSVVLLDLMMPHEGGMTVIKHLRETKPAMLQKVILLTATPDAVTKSFAKDVYAIVRKPFEASDLIDAVRKLT